MVAKRTRKPKVTATDYKLAAAFLKDIGAEVASVSVEPGRSVITTVNGQSLTLPPEHEDDEWNFSL